MTMVAEYDDLTPKPAEGDPKPNKGTPVPNEPTPDVSPAEAKARDSGWRPKDEWEGDPDEWVDAKEFNFRGELFDKIKTQSKYAKQQEKELAEMKKAISALGEMNKQISEKEYERALKALKRQKAIALEDDDHEKVVEIDEQLGDLKEAKKASDEMPEVAEPVDQTQVATPTEVLEWIEDPDNSWYKDNLAMQGAADKFFDKYVNENINGDISQFDDWDGAIKYAEQQVKKTFPQNFSNPRRNEQTVGSQGGRASGATKSSKVSVSNLNDEQKAVMKTFVQQGIMTQDEYLAQLEQIGGLE